MGDTYTVSVWSVNEGQESSFIEAFRAFAASATELGGAREGMILHDSDDASKFIVVRRWDDPEVVERWRQGQDPELRDAVYATVSPDDHAHVMTKVADLG